MRRLSLRNNLPNALCGLVALLIVVADQVSKAWIRSTLQEGEVLLETPLFKIDRVSNSGAAFGLFRGNVQALTVVSIVTICVVLFYVIFLSRRFPPLDNMRGKVILGVILGGVIGNLIDRFSLGYVTDFVDFGWWPVFNVADAALTIGSIILAIILIFAAVKSES